MTRPATSAALGVVTALSEHWDALDHDFRVVYGLDLHEACWGPNHLGVRRLREYIARLPSTSEWAREQGHPWSRDLEMQATLVELMHATWHASATAAAGLTGGYKGPKKPLHIPRPGDKPTTMTRGDLREKLRRG